MNKVYVLFQTIDMSDYTDNYGETAYNRENVVGIYSTREKAEKAYKEALEQDKKNVEEYGCDPCEYDIDEMEVK